MKKILLTLTALAALMTAGGCTCCNNHGNCSATACPEETKATPEVEKVAATPFYGTYEGTLPAADCEGIRTTLVLNEDTTYELTSIYLAEEEQEFKTSGVYEKQEDDLIVLITPSSGEKTYYKILDDAVALTDAEGNMVEGELAGLYILEKK